MTMINTKIDDLHTEAMTYVDLAEIAKRENQYNIYHHLIRRAFEKENEAALLAYAERYEPTCSVLHRSAATLAIECKKYWEAMELISRGLKYAREPIASELRDLERKINFEIKNQEKE